MNPAFGFSQSFLSAWIADILISASKSRVGGRCKLLSGARATVLDLWIEPVLRSVSDIRPEFASKIAVCLGNFSSLHSQARLFPSSYWPASCICFQNLAPALLRSPIPPHLSILLGNIIPPLVDRTGTRAYTSRQLVPDRGETCL
jgi:hypothetical protein